MLKCPHCLYELFYKCEDRIKVRTPILVFRGETSEIICKNCKNTVVVDIKLGDSIKKALETAPNPRLILRKNK